MADRARRKDPAGRRYLGSSAVLETMLRHPDGDFTIADWMPLGETGEPRGAIRRCLGAVPAGIRMMLTPRPENGRRMPRLRQAGNAMVVIDERFRLQASHSAPIRGGAIVVRAPLGQPSWAVLSDGAAITAAADPDKMRAWQRATKESWRGLAGRCSYDGPFGRRRAGLAEGAAATHLREHGRDRRVDDYVVA